MEKEFEILGCLQVSGNTSYDAFYNAFIVDFVEANNWLFGGGINEIVDGFYVNPDGSKGKYVLSDAPSNLHDKLTNDLFHHHSLGALIFLINSGRELEFLYKKANCFISKSNSTKMVSIWIDKKEIPFDTMDALIENATVLNEKLIDIFHKTTLIMLF